MSSLDPRQLMILEMTAQGMTDAAIGRRIHYSTGLIKREQGFIRDKLGALDRNHAVKRGFELGLLQVEDQEEAV